MDEINQYKEKITERFLEAEKYILAHYKIKKQSAFAETINVTHQHIANLKTGKSHVNAWLIGLLITRYPEINPDYLLSGKDKLLRSTEDNTQSIEILQDYIKTLQADNTFLKKEIEYLRTLIK